MIARARLFSLLLVSTVMGPGCGSPAGADGQGLDSVDGGADGARSDPSEVDAHGDPLELPHTFSVRWDYRYDSAQFFQPAARRALLDEAARIWAARIDADFPAIDEGTVVLVRDPETPSIPGISMSIDYSIDDLAVFVGSSPLDGLGRQQAESNPTAAIASVGDATLVEELNERFRGPVFMPWTGWLTFDRGEPWFFDESPQSEDDLPTDRLDFLSIALHELGHLLGIGTSDAFKRLIDNDGFFVGPTAMRVYGGRVPLSPDGMHILQGTLINGRPPLMDQFDGVGMRTFPTSLDTAILADIGYRVTP